MTCGDLRKGSILYIYPIYGNLNAECDDSPVASGARYFSDKGISWGKTLLSSRYSQQNQSSHYGFCMFFFQNIRCTWTKQVSWKNTQEIHDNPLEWGGTTCSEEFISSRIRSAPCIEDLLPVGSWYDMRGALGFDRLRVLFTDVHHTSLEGHSFHIKCTYLAKCISNTMSSNVFKLTWL